MKKDLVLLFTLCAIPALLQAAAQMTPQQVGQELIQAAFRGDTAVKRFAAVKRFLAAGADVNAVNRFGSTALIEAVYWADAKDIVKMLLQAGADVNAAGPLGTALMQAASWGHKDIVEMLLQAGADKDLQAFDKTAEQKARKMGFQDVADLIRDYKPSG